MVREYYSNFKRYNRKGQRLAIFATEVSGELEIFVLRCSRKDQFEKRIARELYNSWEPGLVVIKEDGVEAKVSGMKKDEIMFHPEIVKVKIDGNRPRYSFLRWCNENTYKEEVGFFSVPCTYLTKGETFILK